MTTERIKRLQERRLSSFSVDLFQQRAAVYTETYKALNGTPLIMKKAKAMARFLREKDILLFEDDLIAGYAQNYDYCEFLKKQDYIESPHWKYYYPVVKDLLRNDPYWDTCEDRIAGIEDPRFKELLAAKDMGVLTAYYGHGHIIADYPEALIRGLGEILALAERKNQELRSDFSQSAVTLAHAFQDYVLRYSAKAKELALTTVNNQFKKELVRIAEACEWISYHAPRTFFEALQLFWLFHEALTIEQPSGSLSIGRFDQFLYPFFKTDIQNGTLSAADAQEMIDAIWIKFNVPQKHWRALFYQNLVIGGQTETGEDATNELSELCLNATGRLRMPQPALTVRVHQGTPDSFLMKACKVIAQGGGLPALFNDETVIRAKTRLGVTLQDARNYGIVGCVEPSVPGKEWGWTEAVRINWAKVLELTLTGGVCAVSGKRIRVPAVPGASCATFRDFTKAYQENLDHFIELAAYGMNKVDEFYSEVYPVPFMSTFMEGCLEKGRDLTQGALKYNFTSINACGIANTADSLAVIEGAVYKKKLLSLPQLTDMLAKNFSQKEISRLEFVNKYPKFGNDLEAVDAIMKDLCEHVSSTVSRFTNPRQGRFQCGLYTVDSHMPFGEITGALPDGRVAGKALANSFAPVQGMDRTGPTAVIKSATKIDHSSWGNGMVLDVKVSPWVLSKDDGLKKLKDMIRTYFHLGGMEIQVNVITNELLRKAKQNPDEYRNLVVRVSGFSAYFTALEESLQNEIIERAEHQL